MASPFQSNFNIQCRLCLFQVPQSLDCHPNNKVLAMKLPFLENMASIELKNATGQTDNDTMKVCYISRFCIFVEVARIALWKIMS